MLTVKQTAKTLCALAKTLVDNEHRMTEMEQDRLVDAVFKAIAGKPASESNNMITWRGETRSIPEWSRRVGINRTTLFNRFKRGWGVGMALTKPVGNCGRKKAKEAA